MDVGGGAGDERGQRDAVNPQTLIEFRTIHGFYSMNSSMGAILTNNKYTACFFVDLIYALKCSREAHVSSSYNNRNALVWGLFNAVVT